MKYILMAKPMRQDGTLAFARLDESIRKCRMSRHTGEGSMFRKYHARSCQMECKIEKASRHDCIDIGPLKHK